MHITSLSLQVAIVLLATFLFSKGMRALRQPVVIAELAAGFLLGPIVLGALMPGVAQTVFPVGELGGLQALGDLGLLLFMVLIGAELHGPATGKRVSGNAVALVALIGFAVPAGLGLLIAPSLHEYAGPGVGLWTFAAFLALCLATSAVPVMARMLKERGEIGSKAGVLALGAAAFGDLIVWVTLPVILGLASLAAGTAFNPWPLIGLVGLVAVLNLSRTPLRAFWVDRPPGNPASRLAALMVGGLACASITHALGLHGVIGALLWGVFLPRGHGLAEELDRFFKPLSLLLLPCFFVSAGLSTSIPSSEDFLQPLLLVLGAAVLGKLVAGFVGASLTGADSRTALSVAALINTRGIMELVLIKIGLDQGLIRPELYTVLFIMALVTTAMTSPLLDLIMKWSRPAILTPEREQE
jgi:Kef-type K+ transport system membrane component KefB